MYTSSIVFAYIYEQSTVSNIYFVPVKATAGRRYNSPLQHSIIYNTTVTKEKRQ